MRFAPLVPTLTFATVHAAPLGAQGTTSALATPRLHPTATALGSRAYFAGGAGLALGDGLRCGGGNVIRLGTQSADASGDASYGPGLRPQGSWSAGDTRYLQVWYRDPVGGPCGSDFNLTPGVEARFFP